MKFAYADPPYPGCAHLYKAHPDFAGEVDHRELVARLRGEFDGWVLHTHVAGHRMMEREKILPDDGFRVCQWFKPFAAFKRNVPVAYVHEPVLIAAVRKPVVSKRLTLRDVIVCEEEESGVVEGITMKRGLTGAKPEKVCWWVFELAGLTLEDELVDLFPGTGAVTRAWESWRRQFDRPEQVVMCA